MNELQRHISWIFFFQLERFGHQCEVIFLLGHWNNEGLGCTKRMAVPEIHEALMQIPGCSGFGRHKYFGFGVFEVIPDFCFAQKWVMDMFNSKSLLRDGHLTSQTSLQVLL